jgi:NAD(P)H-nitrite reductase large subunit
MSNPDELCYCFHVSQRKIVNYIRIHQPKVPSQISECGGAGTGCGWCVPFLRKLFDTALQNGQLKLDIDPTVYAAERAAYIQRQKQQRANAGNRIETTPAEDHQS